MLLDQVDDVSDSDPIRVVVSSKLFYVHPVQICSPILQRLRNDNAEPLFISLDSHLLSHELFIQKVLLIAFPFLLVQVRNVHLVSAQEIQFQPLVQGICDLGSLVFHVQVIRSQLIPFLQFLQFQVFLALFVVLDHNFLLGSIGEIIFLAIFSIIFLFWGGIGVFQDELIIIGFQNFLHDQGPLFLIEHPSIRFVI